MTRRARLAALAVGGLALGVASPFALRALPFFRVRRVEVVGARYLAPERIVEALGLAPDQNLFDPLGAAESRAEGVPGVVRADLSRRVPGTLRVTVVEREPVGLASGRDGMVPLDCEGRALPYDATRAGLALPIVERADSVLVRALCVVRAGDAGLYDAVGAVRSGGGGSVILDLGTQRVRLRGGPATSDVVAVTMVRRYLAEQGRAFAELDARYQGLVFARGRRS